MRQASLPPSAAAGRLMTGPTQCRVRGKRRSFVAHGGSALTRFDQPHLRAQQSARPCLHTRTPGWETPWSSAGSRREKTAADVSSHTDHRCPDAYAQNRFSSIMRANDFLFCCRLFLFCCFVATPTASRRCKRTSPTRATAGLVALFAELA